ncbi:ankyrin repeat domain-containing protein [Candidatus Dependentiae bacterium]|nr:ankyrin repeat domain-containing protein [Candidatus Dependentiae bacterium]
MLVRINKLFLKMIVVLFIAQVPINLLAMQQAEHEQIDSFEDELKNSIFNRVATAYNDLEDIDQNALYRFNNVCWELKNFALELASDQYNLQSVQLLAALKTQSIMQSVFVKCLHFFSEDDAKKAVLDAMSHRDEWNFFFAVCLPNNNPNALYSEKYKATQLHFAAACGFTHALQALLNAGARVNEVDAYKLTPLHCASMKKNNLCMEILIQAGADQEAQDIWGRTPQGCYGAASSDQ